jgi:hypothetical protein
MNYQEICGLARYESETWARELKAKHDAENVVLLAARQERLDAREGVRVGDFILSGEKVLRVAHDWGDDVQPTYGNPGGSFYLTCGGGCSFSGSLDSPILKTSLVLTDERRAGSVWFFSRDHSGAGNGYDTEAFFRVWRVVNDGQ